MPAEGERRSRCRSGRQRDCPAGNAGSASGEILQLGLRLQQPELHAHLAVHRRGGDEVLARLVPLAGTPVEHAEPEVAAVGITEAQARHSLARTDIYKAVFRPLKATLSGRDTTVLLKLVVDGHSDRVVGCHMVGEGAAEIIQLAAVAVKMGATKADFDAATALHPTIAEELVTMRSRTASYARAAAE